MCQSLAVAFGLHLAQNGSAYDLIGTSAVGLRTYWHNRVRLARPERVAPPEVESPTLDRLIP